MRARIKTLRSILARSAPGLLTVGLVACAKPVVFQGDTTLAVTASPPAKPPAPAPRVVVRDNHIEISDKIQFDYDKATIKPESFDLMNEIVSVIQKNPQIKKLRVEGYASSEGSASHNLKLSKARAGSVMKYLVDHGIAQGELVSEGYGVDHPIADNSTEEGREKNRRVEFNILEQDVTKKTVQIDPTTGEEKVIEENHEKVTAPGAAPTEEAAKPAPAPAKAPAAKAPAAKAAEGDGHVGKASP